MVGHLEDKWQLDASPKRRLRPDSGTAVALCLRREDTGVWRAKEMLTNAINLAGGKLNLIHRNAIEALYCQLNNNTMLALRQKAIRASGRLPLAAAQASRQYSSPPTPPTEEIKEAAVKYQNELKRIRAIEDPVAQKKEFALLRTDFEKTWESQKGEILQQIKGKHSEHGHEDHGHHHADPTPESLGVSDPLSFVLRHN